MTVVQFHVVCVVLLSCPAFTVRYGRLWFALSSCSPSCPLSCFPFPVVVFCLIVSFSCSSVLLSSLRLAFSCYSVLLSSLLLSSPIPLFYNRLPCCPLSCSCVVLSSPFCPFSCFLCSVILSRLILTPEPPLSFYHLYSGSFLKFYLFCYLFFGVLSMAFSLYSSLVVPPVSCCSIIVPLVVLSSVFVVLFSFSWGPFSCSSDLLSFLVASVLFKFPLFYSPLSWCSFSLFLCSIIVSPVSFLQFILLYSSLFCCLFTCSSVLLSSLLILFSYFSVLLIFVPTSFPKFPVFYCPVFLCPGILFSVPTPAVFCSLISPLVILFSYLFHLF